MNRKKSKADSRKRMDAQGQIGKHLRSHKKTPSEPPPCQKNKNRKKQHPAAAQKTSVRRRNRTTRRRRIILHCPICLCWSPISSARLFHLPYPRPTSSLMYDVPRHPASKSVPVFFNDVLPFFTHHLCIWRGSHACLLWARDLATSHYSTVRNICLLKCSAHNESQPKGRK